MVAIKVEDLRKEYDVASGTEVAVNGVSFRVEEGEFLTLVGPSGCGKTTTLRCVAGLETPTSGTITFDGVDVTDVPANRRGLAMMFQNIALYPHMTLIDNISYPLKVDRVDKEERYEKARKAAELMQISDLLDKYPGEVSGGQRQRAALARTLVQDPDAFLMDEPLSDLDATLKVEIRKEIQNVHRRLGKPTIYVTHDQVEAMTMSDRIAIMNDGRIEQIGSRDEVYNYPNNVFVAKFIGNPSMNIFDATVRSFTEDKATVEIHGSEIEFIPEFTDIGDVGETVQIGVRPQDIHVGTGDGHLKCELVLVEPIDERALATLQADFGEIQASIPSENDLTEGTTVSVSLSTEDIYVFDAQTGDLITAAGKRPKPTA
jgi:multiple sugar transport system ATP-binding protein